MASMMEKALGQKGTSLMASTMETELDQEGKQSTETMSVLMQSLPKMCSSSPITAL